MDTPPPPWDCRVEAIAWLHRAAPRARDGLPAPLRDEGTVPLGAGALLRYVESPVGPYAEVVATPLLLRVIPPLGHVPFIAVDSVPSLHRGRDHWALPKTLATFDPGGDVHGGGWTLRVVARTADPSLPAVLPFAFTQLPGTRARCLFRGWFRLARVELHGDGLPAWMPMGTHPGAVARGRLRVGQPRSSS